MVGACGYSTTALNAMVAARPTIVVLDSLSLAVGPQLLLRHIHQSLPAVRTVMIGMEPKEGDFLNAVREGVAGYILHEASAAEVLNGIRAVAAGEAVCPPCFSAALFHYASQQLAICQNLQVRNGSELSRREQQLVELVCAGLTNKEIAGKLHLSEHTVKNHVHRILRKTGSGDRIELIDLYRSGGEPATIGNPYLSSEPAIA